jgi:hypothetical protein
METHLVSAADRNLPQAGAQAIQPQATARSEAQEEAQNPAEEAMSYANL